ncbi:LuxR family transcriptional regulator [Massilia sp. AB1]|nr:LuxR family transcriptional regulator [Massilia sp. AB1]MBQ5962983.1 LuxR family transcriptional regulator [Massilia sp. ZL223]
MLFKLARGQGFDRVLYGVANSRHSRFDSAFLRSNYASEWRERYDRKGFAQFDPVVGHCMTSSLPIVWEPATFAEPAQRAMYEEASEFGIRSGVTLPVHGPQGEFGVLSFASDAEPDEAFHKSVAEVLPGLSLIRDYAFASSAKFRVQESRQESAPRLTRRELEVLQWVAAGKSSWEIARITTCSEATVNFHLANVRQKFGVNTRQQAVVKAIALGLISPEDPHR